MIETEKALEIMSDFFNAVEAAAVDAKHQIMELVGVNNNVSEGLDVDKLPFISYKTKETAKENEVGWIFSNKPEAADLLGLLRRNSGKMRIGNFDYQLQGNEKFIARIPKKAE